MRFAGIPSKSSSSFFLFLAQFDGLGQIIVVILVAVSTLSLSSVLLLLELASLECQTVLGVLFVVRRSPLAVSLSRLGRFRRLWPELV